MRAALAVATLSALAVIASMGGVAHAYTVTKFLYALNTDGTADVKVFAANITSGETEVIVNVDAGVVGSSVRAYDSGGNLYPTDVTDHSVIVYTTGSIDYLTIEYTAIVGAATASVVNVTITPSAPATVELPAGSSLIAFNGSPQINVVNNKLVLEYGQAGSYFIAFTNPSPPATTTTTTTPPAATTTTTTTTTQTATTTTTSTTTTTITPPQTTTTQTQATTTTTTPPPGAGTTTTTATQVTGTTTTAGAASTTTTPAVTTSLTSSPTHATPTTTPQPPSGGNVLVLVGAAIALAAIAIGAAVLLIRRSRGAGTAGTASPPEELDDRDRAILGAVSGGGKSISDLARELGLSKSVVWRRVNKLAELGLIRRVQDKTGRVILELTDRGRELLS